MKRDEYCIARLKAITVISARRGMILLVLLLVGFGCAPREQSPTVVSTSSGHSAVRPTAKPAFTHTVTPVRIATLEPSSTPSPMPAPTVSATLDSTRTRLPSSTPNQTSTYTPSTKPSPTSAQTPEPKSGPILDTSALKGITVFVVSSVFSSTVRQDKAEMISEIWRTQADGSGMRSLLHGDVLEGNWLSGFGSLRLSHNGRKLSFVQSISHWQTSSWSTSLWTMDVDGSDAKEWVGQIQGDAKPGSTAWTDKDTGALHSKPRPVSPAWSPDDSKIAFVDLVDEDFGMVCVLDLESGQWRQVSGGDVVAWSPDGQALAVRRNAFFAETYSIQIVNLDGRVQTTLELSPDVVLLDLDWSESSGLIVALGQTRNEPIYNIYIIDPLNKQAEIVVENVSEHRPQWSPDGKTISFARKERGTSALYVLDFASRERKLILPQVDRVATWSPDGRFLLARSYVDGYGLYIVSVLDGQYWKIPSTDGDIEGALFNSYDWLFPFQ
jgi:Tol biopolymer transport system component